MPVYFNPSNELAIPGLPKEPKGLTVDIGGDTKVSDLAPHEELAKKFGVAIEDTVKTGIGVGSAIPGVKEVVKGVADSPVGDAAGAFFDILNIPSEFVQGIAARMRMNADDMPMDIKNMIAMGKSDDEIVKYMIETQRAFSNDRSANLLFSILLDPLNFTPLAFGKVRYLKTLTGLAGAAAGGAVGGAALAGPVGMLGGALLGSTLAARKFSSVADKAYKVASVAGEVAGDAAKISDMPKLSQLESIIGKLDKNIGYDASRKLKVGSSMSKSADKWRDVLADAEKSGDAEKAREAKAMINQAEGAVMEQGAISNPIALGVYNGLIGGKNVILSPIQKRVSLALFGPAVQQMHRELGGYTVNEVGDILTDGALAGSKTEILEGLGRGMSEIGVGGIQRALFSMEDTLGLKIASRTSELYFEAAQKVNQRIRQGEVFVDETEAIVSEMIDLANKSSGNANDFFLTSSKAELLGRVKRIKETHIVDELKAGPKTSQAIKDIGLEVTNRLIESRIQTIRKSGKSLEEVVLDRIKEVGPGGFAAEGSREIRRATQSLIPKLMNRESTYIEFRDHMMSILAHNNISKDVAESIVRDKFDRIFGKLFDESGNLAKNESATEAAKRMLIVQSTSFSTSNAAASTFNRNMAAILSGDAAAIARITEKIGPESAQTLRGLLESVNENIGKIQISREGFMFQGKVLGLIDVWDNIAAASGTAAKDTASNSSSRTMKGLVPEAVEIVGTRDDVIRLRQVLVDMIIKAKRPSNMKVSTEYVEMLTELNKKLGKAMNLNDARRIWQETVYNSLDDVRTSMGAVSRPDDIAQFLREAIDNGLTIDPLSPQEASVVMKAAELMGINPEVLQVFLRSKAYRLTRQPKGNVMSRTEVMRNADPTQMRNMVIRRKISPYVDMTSKHFDDVAMDGRYTLSRFQHTMNTVFSPIGQDAVAASIRRRLTSQMARGGVGANQIEAVLDELLSEAIKLKISPRGLDTEYVNNAFRNAFEKTSGTGSYRRFLDNFKRNSPTGNDFDPQKAMMHAFRGDTGVVGLTQGATGTLKEWMPSIANYTDVMYPKLKFKLNPLYWIQEYFESPTLNRARGVDTNVISGIASDGKAYYIDAKEAKDLALISPEARTLIDNNNFLSVFREDVLKQSLTGNYDDIVGASGLLKNLKSGRGWDDLALRKESQRDALAMDLTAKQFSDHLMENSPEFWASLVSHYGLKDSRDVFVNFVEFRRSLSDPARVATQIELARPAAFGYSKIPDPNLLGLSEAENLVFRGIPKGGKLPVDDENMALLLESKEEWARGQHFLRPDILADNLEVARYSLRESGYDMSYITPAIDDLKVTANKLKQHRIVKPTEDFPDGLIADYNNKRASLRESFKVVKTQARTAEHRLEAAKELLRLANFGGDNGQLAEESLNIAQALAMGSGYGGDITGVSKMLDQIVREVSLTNVAVGTPEFSRAVTMLARSKFANDSATLKTISNASYQLVARHGSEEMAYRAFQYVYNKTLQEANSVHYVNTDRSFFERSINHPILGLYPYTYMFKKILPEIAAFLFKRPFGLVAPGAGYQAYHKIREYVEYELENDMNLREAIEKKPETLFMLTSLFPGVPWDISVVPPSWLRAVATRMSGRTDKNVDLFGNILQQDILDRVSNLGVISAGGRALSVGSELMSSSERPPLEQAEIKLPRIP